jgi:hypothetical protein
MNVSKLAPYAKAVVALLGFLLLLAKCLSDGQLTSEEVQTLLVAGGVVVGVHQVPNKPAGN